MSAVRNFRVFPFGAPGVNPQSLGIPSAAYPGRVATNSDLIVAVDRQQTTLAIALTAAATSMTVTDSSLIVAYSLLSIDNELVKTTGPASGNTVPIARGFDGTTPAIHAAGALVSGMVDAWHHNALVAEVEAIETFLGPNGANLPSAGYYVPLPFAPQTPGGNLIAGSNVITLSPVPAGVNATDQNHFLYISGGAGAAEAALITGGTAVAGAPSGTVIVTCANTHSGAWTIQSATAGIMEAVCLAQAAGGGTVHMPAGKFTLHSRISVPGNTSLIGAGRGVTILQVAAGEFQNTPPWQFAFNPSGVAIGAFATAKVTLRSFTVDMQGATQTAAPNGGYGIELINVNFSLIEDTEVNNGPILTAGNTFIPYGVQGTSNNNLIFGNYVFNQVGTVSGEGSGGFMIGGTNNRVIGNYVSNGCNAPFVSGGTNIVFIANVFELLGSTQVAGSQAFSSDNGTNITFIGNVCIGNGTGPAAFAVTTDANSPVATNTTFIGNVAQNCGQGYQLSSNADTISGVSIQGGAVVNCAVPLSISGGAGLQNVSISGVPGLLNAHADSVKQFLTLANGANQNVNPSDAGVLRIIGPSAPFSIGGFSGGIDGRELVILNPTGQPLTINNVDPGSLAVNRIATGSGANMTLAHQTVTLRYSLVDNLWFVWWAN
jgi:Pectate lyase superfamily protein